tara:strand:+ start:1744 stop:2565 length:822 start_codon:yes stop_codon:yes gene_type:complete
MKIFSFKIKKPFGSIGSFFSSKIRSFFRKIRVVIKGNYFVTNDKSYVDSGMAANHVFDFLQDEKFMKSYNEGKKTGALKNHPGDILYRAYIACYFSKYASKLDGDFVECGVGKGILSKTIVTYLNFEKINKFFYLFDTFEGIPLDQGKNLAEKEMMKFMNTIHFQGNYYDQVCKTFSKYNNIKIIRGVIPQSLKNISIDKISYISMDMNNAFAEIECIKFFWDKIVNSGIVLLDDYATHEGFREQKISWDNFAKDKKVEILTLPTGQGLIIKN